MKGRGLAWREALAAGEVFSGVLKVLRLPAGVFFWGI
jgi:hypothetical protein